MIERAQKFFFLYGTWHSMSPVLVQKQSNNDWEILYVLRTSSLLDTASVSWHISFHDPSACLIRTFLVLFTSLFSSIIIPHNLYHSNNLCNFFQYFLVIQLVAYDWADQRPDGYRDELAASEKLSPFDRKYFNHKGYTGLRLSRLALRWNSFFEVRSTPIIAEMISSFKLFRLINLTKAGKNRNSPVTSKTNRVQLFGWWFRYDKCF